MVDAGPTPPPPPPDAGPTDPLDIASDAYASALTRHTQVLEKGDLDAIKKRGVLRVVTRNSSTSYFMYRGRETGFSYHLAKLLADELGVRLQMVVPPTGRDLVPWVLAGRGDIVIGEMSTAAPRAARVRMTRPYMKSPFIAVVRAPGPDAAAAPAPAIPRAPADLAGRDVLASPSSGAMARLRALRDSGVPMKLRAARETMEAEELLDGLLSGDGDVVVLQKRLFDVWALGHPGLTEAFALPGGDDEAAFAVRKGDTALWAAADDFLRRYYRGTVFNSLYNRYHKSARQAVAVQKDALRGDRDGRLSPWDAAFQTVARQEGIDWRLLVSQAYQESRFNPNAKSPFGAQGLMQMLPETAREVGVKNLLDPEDSIRGGARYLTRLMRHFDKPDIAFKDRVRFGLAAYNVGLGHVLDARRLARAKGWDANRWFQNVERALRLLEKPAYHRKARFGYCRGSEPVKYVSEIQSRYDAYVKLTTPEDMTAKHDSLRGPRDAGQAPRDAGAAGTAGDAGAAGDTGAAAPGATRANATP